MNKKTLYTNGAYIIHGYITDNKQLSEKRIIGAITKTKYPSVYYIGQEVDIAYTYGGNSNIPQWRTLEEIIQENREINLKILLE